MRFFRRFPPLIALGFALVVAAAPHLVRAADDGHEHSQEDDSPLHVAMEKMGKLYRGIGKSLREPDPARKADYLGTLQKIEALAVEAKSYVPESIDKLPAAKQPAKLAQFRSDLDGAIETMLELERSILADDWATAKALARKLGEQRRDGHEKYNPDPDDKMKH